MKQGNPDHCKKSSSSTSKQKMFETLLTDLISHDSSYEEYVLLLFLSCNYVCDIDIVCFLVTTGWGSHLITVK
jgi:hypothetical protein